LVIDWLAGERNHDLEAIVATLLEVFGAVVRADGD
jgi:hypothetical protein